MSTQFKSLEFIYQDMEIHFLVNPHNNNVMINATEMAKAFDKRVDDFTRLISTTEYIKVLLKNLNIENNHADVRDYNEEDVLNSNKKRGTYMHRLLALKFAQWLDVEFELWINKTIDSILFGNYKKHWDAHQKQEQAKLKIAVLKNKLLTDPTVEIAIEYFETEKIINDSRSEKQKALLTQYKIEGL